jgi:hypothetical protein
MHTHRLSNPKELGTPRLVSYRRALPAQRPFYRLNGHPPWIATAASQRLQEARGASGPRNHPSPATAGLLGPTEGLWWASNPADLVEARTPLQT